MQKAIIAALSLCVMGCADRAQEEAVMKRCETLLAAQELNSLPEKLRDDPRAAIRFKDTPRISDGDGSMFARRSYDRLIDRDGSGVIEARDYQCTFDKKINKVATLVTNGHQQEFRLSDDEWSIMQKGGVKPLP